MLQLVRGWKVGNDIDIDAWNRAWIEEGIVIVNQTNILDHMKGAKVQNLGRDDGT